MNTAITNVAPVLLTPNGKSYCHHHLMPWHVASSGISNGMHLIRWQCGCSDPCEDHTVQVIEDEVQS